MNITIGLLDKTLKKFLTFYILLLLIGMIVGLVYLTQTTKASKSGTIEQIKGSEVKGEFDIQEKYPKAVPELLVSTHNHIFGMGFVFFTLGIIFYFSRIKGFWKSFFLIEPLISTIVTFGSIWLIRFVNEGFVYLTIASAVLMYSSFFFMSIICLYELNSKKVQLGD